jgi:hypothetical protein
MMYESRKQLTKGRETQELEQGDVLRGVLTPEAVTGASFGIRRGGSWIWEKPQLPASKILEEEKKGPRHDLRVITKVVRDLDCMVLSNSCDNYSGDPILLAPLHPFEVESSQAEAMREQLADAVNTLAPRCGRSGCHGFALKTGTDSVLLCDVCAKGDSGAVDAAHAAMFRAALAIALTPEERRRLQEADAWLRVSRAATGHTKSFYMPASPPYEFIRSEVDLNEIVAVEPTYLARCLGELNAQRLFGLTPDAARHLQRTLDFFFARHPRDDHAWPSREDFELKLVWLDHEILRGGRRVAEYTEEREAIRKRLDENPGSW